MGSKIEFPSNAHTCNGYFAAPKAGKGPGVVVIQEWWGLVPHIEDIVERFAKEGFAAVAPDLYHGKTTKSPDEAGRMLMELDADRAEREIAGAGEWLLKQPACSSKNYGVVGFCMGGALAQYAGTKEPNAGAVVSFYGGFRKLQMDWKNLRGPILLIYGETDANVKPDPELEKRLKSMGKNVQVVVYPDAGHAFFNDTRKEVYRPRQAADAWKRTIDLFRSALR
ncbi:MAG TPA: dienelactone hydrolase family protein [Thermoanaerobaculia bacterium]|nr:dienelactone hydrolase family protein [Thermoanaerobaculia bacterium]